MINDKWEMVHSDDCAFIERKGGMDYNFKIIVSISREGITKWREKPFDRWWWGGDHWADLSGGAWEWHVIMPRHHDKSALDFLFIFKNFFSQGFFGFFFFCLSFFWDVCYFNLAFGLVFYIFLFFGFCFILAAGSLLPSF